MANLGLIPPEHKSKYGPIHDMNQKLIIKEKLLEVLGRTNIAQVACQEAGITRATFYSWVKNGFITRTELDEAYATYQDYLRAEVQKRMIKGNRKPLMSNGRVVKDDNNQPIWLDVPSDTLLIKVAEHVLPEWKQDANGVTVNIGTGLAVPAQYLIQIDSRELLPDEIEQIKQIATNIEIRKAGTIIVDAD